MRGELALSTREDPGSVVVTHNSDSLYDRCSTRQPRIAD